MIEETDMAAFDRELNDVRAVVLPPCDERTLHEAIKAWPEVVRWMHGQQALNRITLILVALAFVALQFVLSRLRKLETKGEA